MRALFDSYADNFDQHLGSPGYETPQKLLAEILIVSLKQRPWDCLDSAAAPVLCTDLLGALEQEVSGGCGLVAAADVFVFVGWLDDIVPQVRRVVKPDGLFGARTEQSEMAPLQAERSNPDTLLRLPAGPAALFLPVTALRE